MFTTFAKLLCAAALASVALAQGISIANPVLGTSVKGGTDLIVQLGMSAPSLDADIKEITILIGALSCPSGCSSDFSGLGSVLYTGTFNPGLANSEGIQYENVTVTTPNWLNGAMSINVVNFYLQGNTATPTMETTTVPIIVTGNTG